MIGRFNVVCVLVCVAVLAAGAFAVLNTSDGSDADRYAVGDDSGSVPDLIDAMENAADDVEIYLTSGFTADILSAGNVTVTVNHDHNITVFGTEALVTKTGTSHFIITNTGKGTIRFEDLVLTGYGVSTPNTGGMVLKGGNYEFVNCEFRGLTKTAVSFTGSSNDAAFTNCTFEDNTSRAVTLAGGTSSNTTEYIFTDCLFQRNTVTNSGGGAVRADGGYFLFSVIGCAFIENRAIGTNTGSGSNNTVDGGALYVSGEWGFSSELYVYDSYFERNFAQDDGGAIIVLGYKTQTRIISNIVNSTFCGNTIDGAHYGGSAGFFSAWFTDGNGAAVNYFGMTESEITHCTFYDNGITGALPAGMSGSSMGSYGAGGAIAVETGEEIVSNAFLPQMPKLTNNIFVGNYVSDPLTAGDISFINTVAGLMGSGLRLSTEPRTGMGNVFVFRVCDLDIQDIAGWDPRMLQNNGNIGYDNGIYSNSNGISISDGIQVKNIFAYYNDTARKGDPNTALSTAYGDPVGAAGSSVYRKCFIPSPVSNELYRDGSVPYVTEVPYDTLGNLRDTFPNAGAVEIYWAMFDPGLGEWDGAVPTEVVDPFDPSQIFPVVASLNIPDGYYVMTASGIIGQPSGVLNAMPRSAVHHPDPRYGFAGWRSSIPDLNWSGYGAWAADNGYTESTVQAFLASHPLSDLPADAFPLYQPGDVIQTAKQTLTAEWYLDRYRVDFDLNYDAEPVWYHSSEPGKEAPRIMIDDGITITAPLDPERRGYVFLGWYKDSACTDPWDFASDTVTTDIILYAKWEEAPEEVTEGSMWPPMLLIMFGVLFLLIFLDDDEEVYGNVSKNGKGVAGVRIGYTENGVPRTAVTDRDGDYSISTDTDSVIIISDVVYGSMTVSEELPVRLVVDKDRIEQDFTLVE